MSMLKSITIRLCLLMVFICSINAQNTNDSSKTSWSIYSKVGVFTFYPAFRNNYSKTLVGPAANFGANLNIGRVQMGMDLGYLAIVESNSNETFTQHITDIHLNVGISLFNIKRNILQLNGGIDFYIPFLYETKLLNNKSTYSQLRGLGCAPFLGLTYKRIISERFVLFINTNIYITAYPTMFNSMITYYPSQTIQLGVEYFLPKKRKK